MTDDSSLTGWRSTPIAVSRVTVAAPHGTRGSALYVCGYYAGSSVFGALLGLAWSGAGWPGVAAGVGALTVAALVAAGVVIARTSASARG